MNLTENVTSRMNSGRSISSTIWDGGNVEIIPHHSGNPMHLHLGDAVGCHDLVNLKLFHPNLKQEHLKPTHWEWLYVGHGKFIPKGVYGALKGALTPEQHLKISLHPEALHHTNKQGILYASLKEPSHWGFN